MSVDNLGIVELFSGDTRRALVDFAVNEATEETWYTKQDIADATGYSTESIRKHLGQRSDIGDREEPGPLVRFGLYEPRDLEGNIVHYRVGDEDIIGMLRACPIGFHRLRELLTSTGRQKLVDFFLDRADPEQSYSKKKTNELSDAGYTSVFEHIDDLVDVGILETVDGTWGVEYQLAETEIVEYLYALNNQLVTYYINYEAPTDSAEQST